MLDAFQKIFGLIKETKTGSAWLFVFLMATFIDLYGIIRFGRSFADLITAPQVFLSPLHGRELVEIFLLVGAFVLAWFYLIPTVIVPFWKWIVFQGSIRLRIDSVNQPTSERGYVYLSWAKRFAIVTNNPLLLQTCAERYAVTRQRDQVMAYLLGSFIFSGLAWIISTPESTCLLCLSAKFVSGLNILFQIVIFTASLPAIGLSAHILFHAGESDEYLYLPELAKEYEKLH